MVIVDEYLQGFSSSGSFGTTRRASLPYPMAHYLLPMGHSNFQQHAPSTLCVQADLGQMTSLDLPSLNSQVGACSIFTDTMMRMS